MRWRASSMSASVGPAVVFISVLAGARLKSGTGIDLEYPPKYLSHRSQRVELAPLDLVEKPAQLGVVRHRALQVRLRPRGGDREHLAGEVLPAPLVEQRVRLEMLAVVGDLP